ncbi:MAG: argonaute/piwi family protein [Alphaproteobacteria bacterium]
MTELWHIPEPRCVFGYGQSMEHPKDGLTAFGPVHDRRQPREMRIGAIGTANGLRYFRQWVASLQGAIPSPDAEDPKYSMFPGFEAAFRCVWDPEPVAELVLSPGNIDAALRHADPYQAIYRTVGLFEERIRRYMTEEEAPVTTWFVVLPETVYEYGRPKSQVPRAMRTNVEDFVQHRKAKRLADEPLLPFFDNLNKAAEAHDYARDFRDQLKGRLLDQRAVIQIVRETTLAPHAFTRTDGSPARRLQAPAEVAWNLATAAYYKAGGQPWRLDGIRPGVCYVGMVYKRLDGQDVRQACCGAQMFLDSGDGLVFKGAVGPWYSEKTREYHLDKANAERLMAKAIEGYRERHGEYPKEVFIHGRTRFDDAEWEGFRAAVPHPTVLVGVRIKRADGYKVFRGDRYTVLRGLALPLSQHSGYLWTSGFVPRLQTYPGREVPNPLFVDVCRGSADLRAVMSDILSLTKVNFNACMYGDGVPVTLRFADRVGRVLTAIPADKATPQLPFKHYI